MTTVPGEVIGQPTAQQQAAAGAGSAAGAQNPWAAYGLNADGTPIEEKKSESPDSGKGTLEEKVARLEAQLAKLPEGFEALSKKVSLVDKLVGALKGDDAQPKGNQEMAEVWRDLKKVAADRAPGVERLLSMLEADPNYLDRIDKASQASIAQHVIGVNEKAHGRVLELAKKAGFKGSSEGELAEMVFPFEQSMTVMINANPELRQQYLSGNVTVVDDIFNRLIKPHVGQRLREKQARMNTAGKFPVAPPRGGASPGSAGEQPAPKPNLQTPKGRAEYHKNAVSRWLGKQGGSDE